MTNLHRFDPQLTQVQSKAFEHEHASPGHRVMLTAYNHRGYSGACTRCPWTCEDLIAGPPVRAVREAS